MFDFNFNAEINISIDTDINGFTGLEYIKADYEKLIKDSDESFRKHLDYMLKCVNKEEWQIFDSLLEQDYNEAGAPLTEVKPKRVLNTYNFYVDVSNLSAGLDTTIDPYEFHRLFVQNMSHGYVVGSFPFAGDAYWDIWRSLGYSVRVFGSGKEHGVDETLHSIMMYNNDNSPNDIVLATGDGNCAGWTNFPDCCRNAIKKNIKVKIVSWKNRLNSVYYEIAAKGGMEIELLDRYKATFLKQ